MVDDGVGLVGGSEWWIVSGEQWSVNRKESFCSRIKVSWPRNLKPGTWKLKFGTCTQYPAPSTQHLLIPLLGGAVTFLSYIDGRCWGGFGRGEEWMVSGETVFEFTYKSFISLGLGLFSFSKVTFCLCTISSSSLCRTGIYFFIHSLYV